MDVIEKTVEKLDRVGRESLERLATGFEKRGKTPKLRVESNGALGFAFQHVSELDCGGRQDSSSDALQNNESSTNTCRLHKRIRDCGLKNKKVQLG